MPSVISYTKLAIVTGAFCCGLLVSRPSHAGSATYLYDTLGRLTQISYDTGAVVKYSYDMTGNRSTELVTGTGILSPEMKSALLAILLQLLLDD